VVTSLVYPLGSGISKTVVTASTRQNALCGSWWNLSVSIEQEAVLFAAARQLFAAVELFVRYLGWRAFWQLWHVLNGAVESVLSQ
jgi:hypothetical protein